MSERQPLSESERNSYIEWCLLFSGYARSFYENLNDDMLLREYEKLVPKEGN